MKRILTTLLALAAVLILPALALAQAGDPAPGPDPTTDVSGFLAAVREAFSSGRLVVALVLALWGLGRMAYKLRDKIAFLANPHGRALVVGATGVLAAAGVSLAAGGAFDWSAILGAVGVAVALYVHPDPKVPA